MQILHAAGHSENGSVSRGRPRSVMMVHFDVVSWRELALVGVAVGDTAGLLVGAAVGASVGAAVGACDSWYGVMVQTNWMIYSACFCGTECNMHCGTQTAGTRDSQISVFFSV